MTALPHSQQGAVLILSLVFMLLLTLLGLATMRSTTLQESMANNVQDRMTALQAAELALRAGEQVVASYASRPVAVDPSTGATPGTDQVWERGTIKWQNAGWWRNHGIEYDDNNALTAQLSSKPRYVIEYLGHVPDSPGIGSKYGAAVGRCFYRITARATGLTDNAQVVLQTTFATRFN